jgi:hypothetical protein
MVEFDLAPTIIVYIIAMALGTFYVFAAFFGYVTIVTGGVLIVAYQKEAYKLIAACRIVLVIVTIMIYCDIFIDPMVFSDVNNAFLQAMNNSLSGKGRLLL